MDIFERRRRELKIDNNPNDDDIFERRRKELEEQQQKEQQERIQRGQEIQDKQNKLMDWMKGNAKVDGGQNMPISTNESNDLPYVKTYKEVPENFASGNILGGIGNSLKGTGQMLLQGLQTPQNLVLNASKAIIDTSKGKKPSFDPTLDTEKYLHETGNDKTDKFYNSTAGKITSGIFGVASDPLTWLGSGGIASEAVKASNLGMQGTKGLIKEADISEKAFNKFRTALKTSPDELAQNNEKFAIEPIKPTTVQGKFTIKNDTYNNAVNEYNTAIETIQNHFKTNQLRADEIPKIKSELGIDLDGIVNKMEQAQQGFKLPNADTMKMKRVSGVASDNTYDIANRLKNESNFNNKYGLPEINKNVDGLPTLNKDVASNIEGQKLQLNINPETGFSDNIFNIETKKKLPNERGFSHNVKTDSAMHEDIRRSFDENPLFHETLKNKDTLSKANEKMSQGFTRAYAEWNKNINKFDPSDIPLARQLANEAAKNGDMETARRIIADSAEKLTQAGQYSQAASILRKSDPATFNTFMENQFKKLNEQGNKMYGKKWTDLNLTDDEMKQLYSKDVISEEEREKFMEGVYDRISQSMPSSKMEKFDAWRRTAMLLNPTTHIRNIAGNGIMGAMRKTSDVIGAGLETATDKILKGLGNKGIERTKSVGWIFDKDLRNVVDNTWQDEIKNLTRSNRYDINNIKFMNRDKRIFESKAMNAVDKFSKDTLNVEDKVFLERAYKDALGGYLKANGIKEVTQQAKDYAQRRAFEATFKQANFLSDTINKAKNIKVLGKVVEGAIPFSQTPANIAMRGVEYSPLGVVKAIFSKTSGKGGAQVIEDLSKSLTGSAALGVGYVLAGMGAAKMERSKSATVAGLQDATGEQSSSIMFPWGSYTFDWAQPASIPLAMGVAFYEGLQKKNSSKADALLNAITTGGDTIVNMTMMKNIKDIFGSGGSVTQKILGIPLSYVEQAIPSILGKTAKSIDTTKRSTYDPNPIKQELNEIQSKIPFASKSLQPDLDVFGQKQSTGGFVQQFFSPGYFKGKSEEPVTKELVRLYKDSKETDFLPRKLKGSLSSDGVEYNLSAKELKQLKESVGNETLKQMKFIIDTPEYKESSAEGKRKWLQSLVNSVYNESKSKYIQSKSK
ncbi:hypothetical protein [Clostridium sp. BNL1100]|uniref:hypothetical protein n=1 Tax=Clostridium sp. BNL1100 TaxID=755731 RepID=UPI00024A7A88|nr:hypothetical protein [Clostridium sp. BNL1100]AEY66592.1 hypothetical protein Clo1100_2421 [Clostridium sp. BNL1100]